jgi:hypothetical protein
MKVALMGMITTIRSKRQAPSGEPTLFVLILATPYPSTGNTHFYPKKEIEHDSKVNPGH